MLTTRLFQIQAVLGREHEIAKQQLAAGNKDRAVLALRKKKYQESLLAKTDGQLENLEHLVCPGEDVQCTVLAYRMPRCQR